MRAEINVSHWRQIESRSVELVMSVILSKKQYWTCCCQVTIYVANNSTDLDSVQKVNTFRYTISVYDILGILWLMNFSQLRFLQHSLFISRHDLDPGLFVKPLVIWNLCLFLGLSICCTTLDMKTQVTGKRMLKCFCYLIIYWML